MSAQLRLGELIVILSEMHPENVIQGVSGEVSSYRGIYYDLAVNPGEKATAGELLLALADVLDTEIQGYKGGDYLMTARTVVWLADPDDDSNLAVVGVMRGRVGWSLATERWDWR